MKPSLSRQPLRMLVLGALCVVPTFAMATTAVANARVESVVHVGQTWLDKAGPEGWASDRASLSSVQIRKHDMAIKPVGDGSVARDVWPVDFLSKPNVSSPFTSVTAPVPEPETYLLMVAGLAVFGFIARRRRQG